LSLSNEDEGKTLLLISACFLGETSHMSHKMCGYIKMESLAIGLGLASPIALSCARRPYNAWCALKFGHGARPVTCACMHAIDLCRSEKSGNAISNGRGPKRLKVVWAEFSTLS
jgi:hypothetical protein